MNTNQKGFASILLIIALVVIIAGWLGYFVLTRKPSLHEGRNTNDSRCTQKAVGVGMCMSRFSVVEFNQITKKCGYIDTGGCSVISPFNKTTYPDSDKELKLCQQICEI